MNIKQKLTSAAVIATMMAGVVAPASFAATNVTIKNNGALSTNKVKVKSVSSKHVGQFNGTLVMTGVSAKSKTGGNSSSLNTGGANTITTGNATNTVKVDVEGGVNENSGNDCGCVAPDTTITVNGNGAMSKNMVYVKNGNHSSTEQYNETVVGTEVSVSSSTGNNTSSLNTNGSNDIDTGNASNSVTVTVGGSTNTN